jgi:hypothetical protein
MNYKNLRPRPGDVIAINDQMSLRFEKLAADIEPVWLEVPRENSSIPYEEGSYIEVTNDVWFIYIHDEWRVMTKSEHLEAYRQGYFNDHRV